MTLSHDLRVLTLSVEKETLSMSKDHTEAFFLLAGRVERLENNFAYLGSCMAATAEELAERKQTSVQEIVRQATLMEALGRALAGFAVWRYLVPVPIAIARVEAAKQRIQDRSKTK